MKARTLIIAEAGVNHNGDLKLALDLIDVAADAGADLVKFQTFKAEKLAAQSAEKAAYQLEQTEVDESQLEMLKRLELSEAEHEQLIRHCASRGIGFFSTGFDLDSLRLLVKLGQNLFKIPSGEITNLPYLRFVGGLNCEVILSSGMASLADIEAAIAVLEDAGTSRDKITLLHCTTEYPAPFEEVNLLAMKSMRQTFGVATGYSDHTAGIEVPIAAVALGAKVIEKHFTLSRELPGPDHAASLEPDELKAMVCAIRNIEQALGDGVKRATTSELRNAPIARKSIVAATSIKAGHVFTEDNLTVKRPGSGVSPMRWDEVIGSKASRDYAEDELIDP